MSTPTTSAVEGAAAPVWNRLVVGFDGSPAASRAVEWAAGEAAARGASLRVVACSTVPPAVDYYGIGDGQRRDLADAVAAVRGRHPDLQIDDVSTHLDPRDALLEAASEADLLMVGGSTSGTAKRWLLASVPRFAARRSACPVIVVRGRTSQPVRRIVVGIDGSNASAAALAWATDEADHHDAELVVVHAWQPLAEHGRSMRRRDLARSDAQCVVDLEVRRCRARTRSVVIGRLIEGEAPAVLRLASDDGDLLAVGSRGRSGFKTLVYGSVALSAVDHADCPVAVIHPRVRTSEEGPPPSGSFGPRSAA